MRQVMNFRFSPKSVAILLQLEEELHVSKTAILEQALRYYAKRELSSSQQPLLQFAGKLSANESDSLLKSIKSSRRNKKKDIKL